MGAPLRIAQISDCHLPASAEISYRGINAYENLARVLQKVAQFAPHMLLASGDLSEDASPSSYQALGKYFATPDVKVLALPGNHDDPELVTAVFPGSPIKDIAVSEHGAWQLIRVNSCIKGRPEGRISSENLKQLAQLLRQNPHQSRLLVLHHQPVLVGSPWIDKYRLQDPDDFLELVSTANGVRAVLWGHVHQGFAGVHQGAHLLACPSSAINTLPGFENFKPDPAGPAFRWLELADDGRLETGIVHV